MPKTDLSTLVGLNITSRRKFLNLTQEKLAEIVSINQVSLSRMESGDLSPKFATLENLAAALNCSVADLFRDQSEAVQVTEASIVDMLKPLPQNAKTDFLEIMAQMARCWVRNIG